MIFKQKLLKSELGQLPEDIPGSNYLSSDNITPKVITRGNSSRSRVCQPFNLLRYSQGKIKEGVFNTAPVAKPHVEQDIMLTAIAEGDCQFSSMLRTLVIPVNQLIAPGHAGPRYPSSSKVVTTC